MEAIDFNNLLHYAGLLVGALAAYFGSQNAMKETLARLEERGNANRELANAAMMRANEAHERINDLLSERRNS